MAILLNTELFLLKLSSLTHSAIIMGNIIWILSHYINRQNKLILFPILITISFVLFQRCLLTDFYLFIKNKTPKKCRLPDTAKDNFSRILYKKISGKKAKDLTKYRLDVINNDISKIKNLNKSMVNQKIQYVSMNILTLALLLNYFNLEHYSPFVFFFIAATLD